MNTSTASGPLIVGMSSSALFNTQESDSFYRDHSLEEYVKYQDDRLEIPFEPGAAFPLAEVMRHLSQDKPRFELRVMSKNEPSAGRRVTRSLAKHNFKGVRSAFTGGEPIAQYCSAMEIGLFLSKEEREVKAALKNGIAAALLRATPTKIDVEMNQLRVAFDFDGVIADSSSEEFYQHSPREYPQYEADHGHEPLGPGPMHSVLVKLCELKKALTAERKALFPASGSIPTALLVQHLKLTEEEAVLLSHSCKNLDAILRADEELLECIGFKRENADLIARKIRAFFSPIEIAVVTARNPPAEERLMTTLASWGIHVDQMFLMGGRPKAPVLQKFRPHIFFDDTKKHVDLAECSVPSSWIPGVETPLTTATTLLTPQTTTTAAPTTLNAVQKISAAQFEAECRKIFTHYMLPSEGKRAQLDKPFRDFIVENRSKDPEERGRVLSRLKRFDLSDLDGKHTPQLNRDRYDFMINNLADISRGPERQSQEQLALSEEA